MKHEEGEVIEMEEAEGGTFKPAPVSKASRHSGTAGVPAFPIRPTEPLKISPRLNVWAQMLNGFIVGLDIMDGMLDRMDRMKKKRRR